MRVLKFKKNSGCLLEVVEFDNGKVASCWQVKYPEEGVPEVAVYDSLEQFLSVRTPERGYTLIEDKEIK